MSILGKIFTKGKKGLTDFGLEEIRVEEKRLEIRENQHLKQIEKYDKLREEVFHQGAKNKSPARRRIYARRFGDYSQRIGMIERELSRVVKELMTLTRVRGILERQRQVPASQNVLQRLKEEDLIKLTTLLEDDKISEEVYSQKLDMLLGASTTPPTRARTSATRASRCSRPGSRWTRARWSSARASRRPPPPSARRRAARRKRRRRRRARRSPHRPMGLTGLSWG